MRRKSIFAYLKFLEDSRIDETIIGFVADNEMIDYFDLRNLPA